LAGIANDPCGELNPKLAWETNALRSAQFLRRCAEVSWTREVEKIHFIYASSGSVYGVSKEDKVNEEVLPVPISDYNKTKMVAERVFLSYKDDMQIHCIRPATVCGVSPRMRLDVSVNMLTYQALRNGKITVFGGDQTRPNIHIQDMANVYRHFLAHPEIASGCYNAGFENISILDIAERVQQKVGAEVIVSASNDPRSYRQDSSKLVATGFQPSHCVADAIAEISEAFTEEVLPDGDQCYTVKWMQKLDLATPGVKP
jgi:nucleoside-diphosphate-sugar epimerase